MPYCPDRKLLFIHITKTGGSSLETAVGFASLQENTKYSWRNVPNRAFTLGQRLTGDKRSRPRLWGVLDVSLTTQHLSYSEIKLLELLPPGALDQATTFTICRNPYDRAVSQFMHQGEGYERFWSEWGDTSMPDHPRTAMRRSQYDYTHDLQGRYAMDHTIRFESLHEDFARFSREVLGEDRQLPWVRKAKQRTHYTDYYTPHTKAYIETKYEMDFDAFQYPKDSF